MAGYDTLCVYDGHWTGYLSSQMSARKAGQTRTRTHLDSPHLLLLLLCTFEAISSIWIIINSLKSNCSCGSHGTVRTARGDHCLYIKAFPVAPRRRAHTLSCTVEVLRLKLNDANVRAFLFDPICVRVAQARTKQRRRQQQQQ